MEKNKPQLEKLMTEGYISELDPKSGLQPNVNAEGGEYVMTPDGSVLQVLGEKHKKGGVNLILPGMTAILSDTKNATIKKSDVKRLKEDYNLDSVKVTDTYADVLDKYSRKIGLTKILVELEDSFKALKKQIDNPNANEATYRVNTNYIAKQIDELSKKKQVKDQAMQGMFTEMFASQEKAKKGKPLDAEYIPTQGEEVPEQVQEEPENAMIQEGVDQAENPENMPLQDPDQLTQTEVFELGGMVDSINSISSKYGWTPRRTYDHLLSKGLIKKYQGGGVVPFSTFYNDNAYAKNERDKQSANKSAYGIVEANKAIQYLYSNFPTILNRPEYKELVEMGENGVPTLKKGINLNKENSIIGKLQADMDKQMRVSAEVIVNDVSGRFSTQDKQRANRYLQEETFTDASKDKGIRTYDNKLGDFTSGRYSIGVNLVKPEENIRLKELGITTLRQLTPEVLQTLSPETQERVAEFSADLPDEADFSISQYDLPKPQAKLRPEEEKAAKADVNEKAIENDITRVAPKSQIPRGYFMPDDSIPPPNALTPESLATLNLQRIDPVRVGIEPQLQNIARERNFAASQLASLPSSQRASVLANIVASSQQAESQAITSATQTNAQNFASAELFNIGQDTQEKMYNNASRLNYEARALKGLDNTQKDINEYFMANRAIHLNNYQQQMDMNRLDNLYPDVSIDMFGIGHYYDPQYQYQVSMPNVYAENALAMSRQPTGK